MSAIVSDIARQMNAFEERQAAQEVGNEIECVYDEVEPEVIRNDSPMKLFDDFCEEQAKNRAIQSNPLSEAVGIFLAMEEYERALSVMEAMLEQGGNDDLIFSIILISSLNLDLRALKEVYAGLCTRFPEYSKSFKGQQTELFFSFLKQEQENSCNCIEDIEALLRDLMIK